MKKHLTDITINGNKHIDGCMQVCFLSCKKVLSIFFPLELFSNKEYSSEN